MKRFKNILVLYDDAVGGDDTLEQAVSLAKQNAARVTIATVIRESQLSPRLIDETEKRLQRLSLSVHHDGVADVDTAVLKGSPFLEIIRQVIRRKHDLVLTGAEAGTVLKDVFFGSTATHLMRKCPCPIWVVKPGQSVPYTNILVAVDPIGATSDDNLNIKIMDLATSLASRDHAVLHVLHAWDVDGRDLDTIRSETNANLRVSILERHHHKHEEAVEQLLNRYPLSDLEYCLHTPRKRPEQAICELVEQEQIDLIVMGTVARTGIPGFFIGSTAESVLSAVKCGMLTVKPDGFQTPISLPEGDLTPRPNSSPTDEKVRSIA